MTPSHLLDGPPHQAYAYSYPHKLAYRRFDPPLSRAALWAREPREALFAYLHIPFCEHRCGFCNLFTDARAGAPGVDAYLDTVAREVGVMVDALSESIFARAALGGGTPTLLAVGQLERALGLLRRLGARQVPTSVEASPATIDAEKLALLRQHGVTRLSVGVQSFERGERGQLGRPGQDDALHQALALAADAGFPLLNLDLIYGIPGQDAQSFTRGIDRALSLGATELYLYPLYVRPLTGLGRRGRGPERLSALYRAGRDHLRSRGWTQRSMRAFHAPGAPVEAGPPYRCQSDGMVGLGCGARSYTRGVHYCAEYAVGADEIRGILDAWVAQPTDRFAWAHHGILVSPAEQRRRWALQGLLCTDGLCSAAWRARFGSEILDDLPELSELIERGWAQWEAGVLRLGDEGMARSDAIGPWLASEGVSARMASAALR